MDVFLEEEEGAGTPASNRTLKVSVRLVILIPVYFSYFAAYILRLIFSILTCFSYLTAVLSYLLDRLTLSNLISF
jgi:hypothetical protein